MIPEPHVRETNVGALRRRVRLVCLLDAAERAGVVPLPLLPLHTLAYLSNVLAPVWNMPVMDGKVLRRRAGPLYPELQRDLDHLVGMGVVTISGLKHVDDAENRCRLEGSYRLNRSFADPILGCLLHFEEENAMLAFLRELAFAISTLADDDLTDAASQDATYSDFIVDFGNVIDFAEWQQRNSAACAANALGQSLPGGSRPYPGEKLHLYVRHLSGRLHRGH